MNRSGQRDKREESPEEFSHDTLFSGELSCRQHREGYRFSLDAVLAAHFLPPRKQARIIDLGSGSGIIALIMAYRWRNLGVHITGFERQQSLISLAKGNIELNGYDEICTIKEGDVRHILQHLPPESFEQLVSNPPFFPLGSGRPSQNREAYQARHQVAGGIEDFLYAASKVLANKGHAVFIYPANGLTDFLLAARKNRLEPKRIQYIYDYPEGESEARLFLIHCQKNGGAGLKTERPFYVYEKKNGAYHESMQRLYEPSSQEASF
ncbi:tRNA1(Val) (adenine(37)-N6)-methyltransferase [Desulfotalea psychrophila]|uniref:Methyltransferase small domain-containing protein n=1 Tax=Desulfotalea psychrophila (strain LSv54 / DSM 12343) TaxID=177439 RepID=Q6AKX9_DESPS|nr:methyltransferase [Desulfotalea psychrophila]CAG36996.1 hypothetical protein DP2267 [Desulfotalea psychrophila LSv54]